MATTAERLGIVETKVVNLDEKIDDLKVDVKDMHDCLDQTRDKVMAELDKMQHEYRLNSTKFFEHSDKLHLEDAISHRALAEKISELEKFKQKWVYLTMGGLAVLGWVSGHLDDITRLLGS